MEISQQTTEANEKEAFQNEITSLKKEIEDLKKERSTKSQIPTRRQPMTSITKPAPQKNSTNSKTEEGELQQQIQINDVIEFIQKNMTTFSDYKKQLQGQFSSETTQTKM